jgi:arginine/lysine/ornithine decarboxylase
VPQQRTPVLDAVAAYRSAATQSWHCPGHKGGQGADRRVSDLFGPDLLASDVWLDTSTYDAVRREAEQLAAQAWGADAAFLLVNGSSSGNHAMLLGTLAPGDEVVVARDAHTSVRTGLVLAGARPVWLSPRLAFGGELTIGVHPDDLDEVLTRHPGARAVLLVSPSYWGIATDLPACAEVAHRHGVPLVVDEAWGAHLPFHPALPVDALSAGADAVVTSLHKMASGLSQGALLLVRGTRLDAGRIGAAVRMTQTTSPLLPLVASIDATRRQLVDRGGVLLDQAIDAARRLRRGNRRTGTRRRGDPRRATRTHRSAQGGRRRAAHRAVRPRGRRAAARTIRYRRRGRRRVARPPGRRARGDRGACRPGRRRLRAADGTAAAPRVPAPRWGPVAPWINQPGGSALDLPQVVLPPREAYFAPVRAGDARRRRRPGRGRDRHSVPARCPTPRSR